MALNPSPQSVLAKVNGMPGAAALPSPSSVLATAQKATSPTPTQSFGAGLLKTVGGFIGGVANTVKSFYTQETQNLQDLGAGKLQVGPTELLKGAQDTFSALGSGAMSIVKGFNQGIARIGTSALQAVAGPDITKKITENPNLQTFTKDITGAPTVPTYQDIYHISRDYALRNNADTHQAGLFGGLAVVGAMFADNPLFAPEGSVFKLSEQGIKDLAVASTDDLVKGILKREVPNLSPLQLDTMAPMFREATDVAQVKALADSIAQAAKAPIRATEGALANEKIPTPDQLRVGAERVVPTPEELKAAIPRETPIDITNATRPEIQSITDQLKIAARKYPSADEFAKSPEAITTVEYHGTESPAIADQIRREGFTVPNERVGISTTQDYTEALDYAKGNPDAVVSVLVKPNAQTIGVEGKDFITGTGSFRPQDVVPLPKDFSLTDFYNQAVAGATPPIKITIPEGPVAQTFSPNILKAISGEKLPGPIADLLHSKFPALTERTRELFASKLAGMKRTVDIEGVLHMLSSTDNALADTAKTLSEAKKINATRAATGGLDQAVASVLTPAEIDKQIALVSKTLQTREETALAQQEYDLLWEHASQPVLDRYNQVDMERSFLQDFISSDPAGELYNTYYRALGRDVGDPTFALEDVMHRASAKAKQIAQTGRWRVDGKTGTTLSKYEQSARSLDTHIEALGFKDFEEAQAAVEKYKKLLDRADELTQEARDLRPRIRAIRILQPMMEDVPVIARPDVAAIDALANPDTIRYDYRDITGFTGQFRDIYRNGEAFFGKHWAQAKKSIFDPFDASKGAMIDEIKGLGDSVDAGIISKYGFKRGSKEDKAIMDFGEREIAKTERVAGMNFDYTSPEGLAKAFGQEKANHIMEAEQWFRDQYGKLIDAANEVRAKIYPNNPSKLIPYRKDYFRHYQELGGDFRQLVDLFETPAGIDPNLAGISEFTKPKSRFLSFAQERIGQGSERSAIGGFLDYAPAFAYMKHIDPHIGKFRYLRRVIAENAPQPGVTEFVEQAGKQIQKRNKGVNNFLEYIDDFSNDLAGKTSPVDRYLQKVVPGGRKTFRAISWLNSRVKANVILGNLSSSIAQFFNVPQGVASAGRYTLPGIQKTLSSIFTHDEVMATSNFLKERYAKPLTARFKLDWVEHPLRASTQNAKEFGVWITQALDEVGTKLIWNSHYSKAVGEGIADPVKYADDMARQMVAGRGIGEVPLGQKGKLFQLVAPFQVEVGNAWWVMQGWVKKKEFGTLATFFIASYLLNEAAQHVRGSRVIFDPINSLMQGSTDAMNELQDGGTPMRAATIFAGRQLGELLSNIPLGQTFAGSVPDTWLNGLGFPGGKQEVFGQGNPGRFGSGLLVLNAFSNPLYNLLLPFGGAQVKKTVDGVNAMLSGEVKSATGALNFKVNPSVLSVIQSIAFGKNATPEAQDFYAKRNDLFMRVYRSQEQTSVLTTQAEAEWKKAKDLAKTDGKQAAVNYLSGLSKTDQQLSDAVRGVAQSEAQGLDGLDRLVSMLGVKNGERAKYIALQVKNLGTRKEQILFLQKMSDEKLIPNDVFAQLGVLLPGVIKPK